MRELVSNAADAADKLRYLALTNDACMKATVNCESVSVPDKEKGTVTIEDNGVGMTRDGVIEHLGTIAKSGTADFFKNLSGESSKDSQLISQFGVGFYSAFIVARKSRFALALPVIRPMKPYCGESEGEGNFTVDTITKASRGTEITLHLRDEEKEFADDWRLRSIITKSQIISLCRSKCGKRYARA